MVRPRTTAPTSPASACLEKRCGVPLVGLLETARSIRDCARGDGPLRRAARHWQRPRHPPLGFHGRVTNSSPSVGELLGRNDVAERVPQTIRGRLIRLL